MAVIGAGNSAMDAARTALRQGSRFVTIYARSNHVTASQREVDYAIADGAEVLYGMAVEKITEQGPVFVKREFSEGGETFQPVMSSPVRGTWCRQPKPPRKWQDKWMLICNL